MCKTGFFFISSYDYYDEGKVLYENIEVDSETGTRRRSPLKKYFVNTANVNEYLKNSNERLSKVAALMKVFKEADWYDEQFPALSARKKFLHETPEGAMELAKEIQLYIDEEVKKQTAEAKKQTAEAKKQTAEAKKQTAETAKKAEETRINDMKNIKAVTGWTTEQTLEAMKIPVDQRSKYANFL